MSKPQRKPVPKITVNWPDTPVEPADLPTVSPLKEVEHEGLRLLAVLDAVVTHLDTLCDNHGPHSLELSRAACVDLTLCTALQCGFYRRSELFHTELDIQYILHELDLHLSAIRSYSPTINKGDTRWKPRNKSC
jgi:hypothetical protein